MDTDALLMLARLSRTCLADTRALPVKKKYISRLFE